MARAPTQPGREDLVRWRADARRNWFESAPHLARVLRVRAGDARFADMEPRLRAFAQAMVDVVDPAIEEVERHRDLPSHVPYDSIGNTVAAVSFHPGHRVAGRTVWASGLAAMARDGESCFEQAALFYLLAHGGEGGHACPLVCTVGLARALVHRGPDDLRHRYLDRLCGRDYTRSWRGSQFLTEVQGGSDVGANVMTARPDPELSGTWRLTGEKWFCSVADADVFAVTARPDGAAAGTRGLGCFLVPRTLDDGGEPNGFRIRRLKDKLGTRALASAEIDFEDAVGWPIGPVGEGFHVAVDELLNTSRWMNALGSAGIMRRAVLEAAAFVRHRRAFGSVLVAFPIVREQLAVIKAEERAALSSTMLLTGLVERLETGKASAEEKAAHRVLVNANKYVTSVAATDVVHRAIELLGGNGTIEDFSPLPRLYRDAIVFESWEGTHNVLCAQVLRDCSRLGLLDAVVGRVRVELAATGEAAGKDGAVLDGALGEVASRLRAQVAHATTPEAAAAVGPHFRRNLDRLVRVVQAACVLREAAAAGEAADEDRALAGLLIRRHLVPGHDPAADPEWPHLVERALGARSG